MRINTYHGGFNRSVRGSLASIKYFVVHHTGSMACARNNCIYFSTGNRNASADLFVDRDGTIWEYNNILDGHYTWHCGDGGGRYGITNANSIGVEVVSDGSDFTPEQIDSIRDLYAHYCQVLGRKLEIVRHYDASRKECPKAYVDAGKWESLKSQIDSGSPVTAAPVTGRKRRMECIFKPNGEGRLVYYDGVKAHNLNHPDEVKAIQMVYKACNGGAQIPIFELGSANAPWATRFLDVVGR